MKITRAKKLSGELTVPGDKSISHRAVMLGALAEGVTEAEGFLAGADCLSTISCFRQMGIQIHQEGSRVLIQGAGLHGLKLLITFWTQGTAEPPCGLCPEYWPGSLFPA